jgi:hypothetical protein
MLKATRFNHINQIHFKHDEKEMQNEMDLHIHIIQCNHD